MKDKFKIHWKKERKIKEKSEKSTKLDDFLSANRRVGEIRECVHSRQQQRKMCRCQEREEGRENSNLALSNTHGLFEDVCVRVL